MKENFEVVRELALALAADQDPKGFRVGRISEAKKGSRDAQVFRVMVENDLTDQEAYYFDLMEERGLIRFVDNRARVHLTAEGQDFVHAVADLRIWDGIKEWVLDVPFDLHEITKSARHHRLIVRAAERSETLK